MNIAIVFAGGSGTRMKSNGVPKQFLKVYGKPIIIYTLEKFSSHPDIDAIAVICIKEYLCLLKELIIKFKINKVKWIEPGGKVPLESQYIGLRAVSSTLTSDEKHIVLMHDGVRPFIDGITITKCLESVKRYGTAITMSPAIETIITVDKNDNVQSTIKRNDCRLGRAPQCFLLNQLIAVHEKALADGIRDDTSLFIDSATLMQYYGYPIHVVEGPIENIKITTPMDFYIFKALIDAKENSQIFGLE